MLHSLIVFSINFENVCSSYMWVYSQYISSYYTHNNKYLNTFFHMNSNRSLIINVDGIIYSLFDKEVFN